MGLTPLSAWWRRAGGAPLTSLDELAGGQGILVLAPHPDDESLGCGGLLAAAAGRVPCRVVLVTDGSRSHPGSLAWPAARLAAQRQEELTAALEALGHDAGIVTALGFVDGETPSSGPAFSAAARRIAALADAIDAGALFAAWREDPHHDYKATAALAHAAAGVSRRDLRCYAYPIWAHARPQADLVEVGGLTPYRFAIADQLAAKRAAIACHLSQHGLVVEDDPSGFVLPPSFVARFLEPYEVFFRWLVPLAGR